jgi:hypothetical protein
MLKRRLFLLSLFFLSALRIQKKTSAASNEYSSPDYPYPLGDKFPLGLYSIHSTEEMLRVRSSGWNIMHTYKFKSSFLSLAERASNFVLSSLPGTSNSISKTEFEKLMANLAPASNIAWWDFPEERRYWRAGEMKIVQNYSAWTREFDSLKRPNYMYIPAHYSADAVQKYIPYLDIIPSSLYSAYAGQPPSWVRWRMEETTRAIKLAGAQEGKNYLGRQKTPVAILELFYAKNSRVKTPAEAYHDFWQAIVSGAKGILVYSYWRKRTHPALENVWLSYDKAAQELSSSNGLSSAILYGSPINTISVDIVDGPSKTPSFFPYGSRQSMSFKSVDALSISFQGKVYVICVNSSEQPVVAIISGLPSSSSQMSLFGGKFTRLNGDSIRLSFAPLGVQIVEIDS